MKPLDNLKKDLNAKKQDFASKKGELKAALNTLNEYIEKNQIWTTPRFKQDMNILVESLTIRNNNDDLIRACGTDISNEIIIIKIKNSDNIILCRYFQEFEEKYNAIKNFPLFQPTLKRTGSASKLYLPSATLGINRQTQSAPSAPSDYGYENITDAQLTELWIQRYPNNISLGPSLADDYTEKTDEDNVCSRATSYFKSWFGG